MIKVMPGAAGSFHNFKCGEVYCLSAEEYKINCCLCGIEVDFADFRKHFQEQHLGLSCTDDKKNNRGSGGGKGSSFSNNKVVDKLSDETRARTRSGTSNLNIKKEVANDDDDDDDERGNDTEDASAYSWADHFQDDDEIPIDMAAVESVTFEHANVDAFAKPTKPTTKTDNSGNSNFDKELNTLQDIGDQGAKVNVYGGDDDDDIDIGVDNDEWLHEKYSYDNVPSSDDDDDDVVVDGNNTTTQLDDLPTSLTNIKVDIYEDDDPMDTTMMASSSSNVVNSAKCEYCDRTFYSEVGLKIHTKAVHDIKGRRTKANKEKQKTSPTPMYTCDDCGDKFTSERQLRFHRYKHTGIVCEICGKKFTQIGNLERHKIRHTGVKSLQCQECDKTFFTDKELNAHMIRHTGIHPHICEVCGKQCRDRGVLTAHMRRHTGERPATCKVCGKSFFCGYDLNVHSVTHTTERPFKCDICGSTFQLKKSLRVHKKIHNKNRDHICKVCGKGFAQSSGLNAHMRMHDPANPADMRKLFETNVVNVHVEEVVEEIELEQQDGSQWNGLQIM